MQSQLRMISFHCWPGLVSVNTIFEPLALSEKWILEKDMIKGWLGKTIRWATTFLLLTVISACGGGGGSDDGGFVGGGQSTDYKLALSLGDGGNGDTIELKSGEQTTLTARVTEGGRALAGTVISVAASGARVEPDSLTSDANGEAVFTVTAGDSSGAATLTATVTGPTGTVEQSISFNVIGRTRPTLTLKLVDLARQPLTEITPTEKGVLEVTVSGDETTAVAQQVISAQTTIGKLVPESGTALTDDSGETYFIIEADGSDGAGTATASLTFEDEVIEATLNFSISSRLPYLLDITLLDGEEEAVSVVETGERVIVSVLVVDTDTSDPIPNQLVSISAETLGTVTPSAGTAITDAVGIARFELLVGQATGAFELSVTATFAGGSITETIRVDIVQAGRSLGYFDDAGDFIEGLLLISPDKALSPGGSAAVSLAVVNAKGERITNEESVTLSSNCLFSGAASIEPDSPLTFIGQTTATYIDLGCSGTDTLTARLESTGSEASGTITFSEVVAEAIRFEAATPGIIAIRDTGSASDLSESAAVTFRITDINGNPVSDSRVNFSLGQDIGGIALYCQNDAFCQYPSNADAALGRSARTSDRSDLDGMVTARVLSGFVASPVRVIAYVDLNENGEQDEGEPTSSSKSLVITTGLPDQNSVSLSASVLNIEGAYEADGKQTVITVRMADKFNNPVPDGTPATFTTELGSIVGSCLTQGGACSVTWTSQSPRSSDTVDRYSAPITIFENNDNNTPSRYRCPSHREPFGPCPDDIGDEAVNPPGAPRGGRSTLQVTAIGEESFIDKNANGRYDQGEYWTNLTEAFIDHNEDARYTPAQRGNCKDPAAADDVCLAGFEETFTDYNFNGVFDLNNSPSAAEGSSLPDGLFNGVLCQPDDAAAGICSRELLSVSDSLVLINSFINANNFTLMAINSALREPLALQGGQTYTLYVSDYFNNPPPPDSAITYEGSGRCDVITPAPSIGDTNRAGAFAVSFAVSTADGEEPTADPDQVSILLTLPSGSQTVKTYSCDVEEPPEPADCNDPNFSPNPPGCED